MRAGDTSTYFDGSEVLPYVDYLKGTGAIAVLSIMPVYVSINLIHPFLRLADISLRAGQGWGGLTSEDNTQALQTVDVLKQFVDAGIEVYLRFGHEMVRSLCAALAHAYLTNIFPQNWYTQPNSDDAQSGKSYYSGGGSEYIEGWKTMAAAVKDALPDVKMFWCPNVSYIAVARSL